MTRASTGMTHKATGKAHPAIGKAQTAISPPDQETRSLNPADLPLEPVTFPRDSAENPLKPVEMCNLWFQGYLWNIWRDTAHETGRGGARWEWKFLADSHTSPYIHREDTPTPLTIAYRVQHMDRNYITGPFGAMAEATVTVCVGVEDFECPLLVLRVRVGWR